MFSLFGLSKGTTEKEKPRVDLNSSLQKSRQAIETLEKRDQHLEKKIADCVTRAKNYSKKKNKKGALFELKKKKQLESQLQSIQGKKLNLETQIMTLEDAMVNKDTFIAMKTGSDAIRAVIIENDADKVDELMEDINEAIDRTQEVNVALSQPLGPAMDEDELEAELAELEDMEADELLSAMPIGKIKNKNQRNKEKEMDVPDVEVPTHKIISKRTEKEELAEFEAMID